MDCISLFIDSSVSAMISANLHFRIWRRRRAKVVSASKKDPRSRRRDSSFLLHWIAFKAKDDC
jgi:hypothetical protein